jgi:isopentenyl phosphate kinase
MPPVTILKLGGSAITDKSKENTPDLPTIHSSIAQVASFLKPLIILHGAGSFGHPQVKRAQLQNGLRKRSQLIPVSETELCLEQLSRIIQVSLIRRGRPVAPLHPMSFLTAKKGEINEIFVGPLNSALRAGLIPLLHGDLVFDSIQGISVISADKIASRLGIELSVEKVLFGCDVDGVFTKYEKGSAHNTAINRIDQINAERIMRRLRTYAAYDATGGMYGKVRESLKLARHGVPCQIFNLKKKGRLADALEGKHAVGTEFPPWKPKS